MVDLRRHLGHSAHDKAVETSRKLARHAAFPSLPLDHPEYGPTEKRADGRRACDGEEDEEEEDEDEDEEEEKEVTVSTSTRLGEMRAELERRVPDWRQLTPTLKYLVTSELQSAGCSFTQAARALCLGPDEISELIEMVLAENATLDREDGAAAEAEAEAGVTAEDVREAELFLAFLGLDHVAVVLERHVGRGLRDCRIEVDHFVGDGLVGLPLEFQAAHRAVVEGRVREREKEGEGEGEEEEVERSRRAQTPAGDDGDDDDDDFAFDPEAFRARYAAYVEDTASERSASPPGAASPAPPAPPPLPPSPSSPAAGRPAAPAAVCKPKQTNKRKRGSDDEDDQDWRPTPRAGATAKKARPPAVAAAKKPVAAAGAARARPAAVLAAASTARRSVALPA